MATIQDIRALEVRIGDIVDDYIDNLYFEDDVLAISHKLGKLTVEADTRDKIKTNKTTEIYLLKDLVRTGNNGKPEADCDKISDIANSWVFVD